jgi:hypothetical protein
LLNILPRDGQIFAIAILVLRCVATFSKRISDTLWIAEKTRAIFGGATFYISYTILEDKYV